MRVTKSEGDLAGCVASIVCVLSGQDLDLKVHCFYVSITPQSDLTSRMKLPELEEWPALSVTSTLNLNLFISASVLTPVICPA